MTRINFSVTKEEAKLIEDIIDRAQRLFRHSFTGSERMSAHMDIAACHANGCPLLLEDLLYASDFDFAHDFNGIARHMDQKTGKLTDCFLPRYANLERKERIA